MESGTCCPQLTLKHKMGKTITRQALAVNTVETDQGITQQEFIM